MNFSTEKNYARLMLNMINSEDISVVVQGAVSDKKEVENNLKKIRKYLPEAEIILSTWENSDTSGLDYDKLVLNQDPGCFKHDFAVYNKPRSMNNFNRQLVSAKNGVFKASRQYCLKLRSDLILNNSNFLKYWDKYNKQNEEYKIFKHRVLCSSIYSREYSCQSGTGLPTPFHPSDFWFFGLTEDLKDYFGNCPLQDKEEGSNWNFKYANRCPYITPLWRYAPEQWFCINWVKKYYPDVQFEDWSDWNEENIELSNNILYNNFSFLGFEESGIYSRKHLVAENIKNNIQGLITHSLYENRYKQYCDNNFQPAKIKKDYSLKLSQHLSKLCEPIKKLNKWIGEIFSVIYYAILCIITKIKHGLKNND